MLPRRESGGLRVPTPLAQGVSRVHNQVRANLSQVRDGISQLPSQISQFPANLQNIRINLPPDFFLPKNREVRTLKTAMEHGWRKHRRTMTIILIVAFLYFMYASVAYHIYNSLNVKRYFGAIGSDGVTPLPGALPVNLQLLKIVYPNMDGITATVGFHNEVRNAFLVKMMPEKFYDSKANILKGNLTLVVNTATLHFVEKNYPDPQKTVIAITGDSTNYPFSKYEGDITVTATFVSSLEKVASNVTIQVALCIIDDTYGVDVYSSYDPMAVYPKEDWNVHFYARHSTLFMMYPVTSMFLMAVVGVTLVFAAYTVATSPYSIIKDTKAFLPALAALIFAIPKYRMELPFAPPLGSLIDYVIFYWVNLMPIVTFVVVMWKHVIAILGEQVDLQVAEDEKERKEKLEKLEKMVEEEVAKKSLEMKREEAGSSKSIEITKMDDEGLVLNNPLNINPFKANA